MIEKVLIANRGEIAVRIIKTLKKMGKVAVAIYNEADINATHMLEADEAFYIGSGSVAETYLNTILILDIIKENYINAVHPGYGLLSENASFAKLLEDNGIVFLGPTPKQIETFGLKHKAREVAIHSKLPILSGTELLHSYEEAEKAADQIGYPVIIKSTGGGGGIGMQICHTKAKLKAAYETTINLAEKNFSNAGVFLEKFLEKARHVEVQIFGDGKGSGLVLGDRDCSIQRRSQKIVEETPAPNIPEDIRQSLYTGAKNLMRHIQYRSAGTIEFLYDEADQSFYFLEVNTRLQVEHTVTEEVFKMDIVEAMIQLQEGTFKFPDKAISTGASMQFRLYSEDPYKNYMPVTGVITKLDFPNNTRIDTWIREGIEVSPFFDPLLAKIIVTANNREGCVQKSIEVLSSTKIEGVETNLELLLSIAKNEDFADANLSTQFLKNYTYTSHAIDILLPGTFTTIQDFPGRTGYWMVGIPPSGPMDNRAFRLGNTLLGNPKDTAGIEITLQGPKIQFRKTTDFVITGATIDSKLNNNTLENYRIYTAQKGEVLEFGKIQDAGQRAYLLLGGGINISDYLGSKSTFTLGVMGGHAGRTLRIGDVLHLNDIKYTPKLKTINVPEISTAVTIDVLYGPHGAPDFFEEAYIEEFLEATWGVHFNSSRTGVRLLGPSPKWTRTDGGDAGLHPSNIHDNAYAIGAIDFTGDTPILLGPDGPSLGGFVCPFTIIKADLWKMGQLSTTSKIKFNLVTYEQAVEKEKAEESFLENLEDKVPEYAASSLKKVTPILAQYHFKQHEVCIRQSGYNNILIELGKLELDLELRLVIHKLFQALEVENNEGIIDITPGVRSLQIHFEPLVINRNKLLVKVYDILSELESIEDITVPSRVIYLPLSWNDPQAKLAMEKYHTTVRTDAPWSPDNIEFIRRINGFESIEKVQNLIFEASYLVMGLGDVYLGAPIATPIDPRHRLVTTKYNPARTWTPDNAVGIGGAYLCIYGMEGPGGYQLFGRTLQMWNTYPEGKYFTEKEPFLLRFFDQIKFYPVSAEELLKIRRDFPQGRYPLKIEESTFSLKEYKNFLAENEQSIDAFKKKQKAAFNNEKEEWIRTGKLNFNQEDRVSEERFTIQIAEGSEGIASPISAVVWKIEVNKGDEVSEGQPLVVLESMKMESTICSDKQGIVDDIFIKIGNEIAAGDIMISVKV